MSLAEDVVGEAEARAKIVEILGIELTGAAVCANLLELPGRCIQETEEVVLLTDHAEIIPAQPVVEGQPLRDAPVVLEVQSVVVFVGVAVGIAGSGVTAIGDTREKVIEGIE